MKTIQEQINNILVSTKNKSVKLALRIVKAEFQREKTKEISDGMALKIIRGLIKHEQERLKYIDVFRKGGSQDKADSIEYIHILSGFIPAMVGEETIRDAITYEIQRGGQIFFIHNRIENIKEVAGMIQRLVPDAKIGIGHGQMEGKKLETLMLAFMNGEFDVLVSTTIVESGLDVSNANTIFINNANNFGLSDLHQMRGRVGRSNKKAFCYFITPPFDLLR